MQFAVAPVPSAIKRCLLLYHQTQSLFLLLQKKSLVKKKIARIISFGGGTNTKRRKKLPELPDAPEDLPRARSFQKRKKCSYYHQQNQSFIHRHTVSAFRGGTKIARIFVSFLTAHKSSHTAYSTVRYDTHIDIIGPSFTTQTRGGPYCRGSGVYVTDSILN